MSPFYPTLFRAFTFLNLVISLQLSAQKQANTWYFGNGAGLDFNNGCVPSVLTDGMINGFEGCATISDKVTGQLLFYTNSENIWNRNHQFMPNGNLVQSGNTITQVLIIEKPGSDSLYYILTSEIQSYSGHGLKFHEVDMSLNSGFGGITYKDSLLYQSPVTEKITAVRHANGTDIWIIAHEYGSQNFLAFQVSSSGINLTPVISALGKIHADAMTFDAIGEMKASPDGSRLAVVTLHQPDIELVDFDNSTGIVSNLIRLPETGGYDTIGNSSGFYGLSFSAGSSMLYASKLNMSGLGSPGLIIQYDVSSNDSATINNSRVDVFTTTSTNLYSMKLAPNRKIYVGHNQANYIGVINFPDSAGTACNYIDNGVYLGGKTSSWGLNNLMEYGNYCIAVTSGFSSSDTMVCEKSCIDFFDLSTNATSWQWFFPNAQPDTSTQQNPANICFNSYGTFDVTLVACNSGVCDTLLVSGFITIFQGPQQPVITYSNDTLYSNKQANSYQWFLNSQPIPGATGSFIVNLQPGSYYCLITDSNECPVTSNTFVFTGLPADNLSGQFFSFANPVSDVLDIHFNQPGEVISLNIYDITGKILYSSSSDKKNSDITKIDTSVLPEGIYFIQAMTQKVNYFSRFVICR